MDIDIAYFVRVFLGAYFTFIALFYSLRLILNKTGQPITFIGELGSSHWYGHITFRVFRLAIWGICVARIFYPTVDNYLGLFRPLNETPFNLFGPLLMVTSFSLILVCHFALRQQWRLGIDPEGPGHIIDNKIYSKSRNPIFIGVLIGQLGFLVAMPSVFSLVCFLIGVVAILNQVKLEEDYLKQKMPSDYSKYCANVPRWFSFR